MVALSVSISHRTSPARTTSPSFFFHAPTLPFVIVGDNAGMATFVCDGTNIMMRWRAHENNVHEAKDLLSTMRGAHLVVTGLIRTKLDRFITC